jgi:hypothetical protein
MGSSARRQQQRAKRKTAKEARMNRENPAGESVYALKRRGVFPPNSPYLKGFSGKRMWKLEGYPELVTVRLSAVEDPTVWREAIGHG